MIQTIIAGAVAAITALVPLSTSSEPSTPPTPAPISISSEVPNVQQASVDLSVTNPILTKLYMADYIHNRGDGNDGIDLEAMIKFNDDAAAQRLWDKYGPITVNSPAEFYLLGGTRSGDNWNQSVTTIDDAARFLAAKATDPNSPILNWIREGAFPLPGDENHPQAVEPAPAPTPTGLVAGDPIVVHTIKGDGTYGQGRCSVNSIHPYQDSFIAVTAAHCLDGTVGLTLAVTTLDGQVLASDLNPNTRWAVPQHIPIHIPGNSDTGAFKLNPGVIADSNAVRAEINPNPVLGSAGLAPHGPISYDPNPLPVQDLRIGEKICKDGAITGRTCGIIIQVDPVNGEFLAILHTASGDSGGAGYVWRDGQARNAGTLAASKFNMITSFVSPERVLTHVPR